MSRADIRAGRAYVSLYTKDKQFNTGLNRAENRLQSFGRTVTRVGAGLTLFGASTMGLSAALGALFRDPIKEAMDFEETITKFRATFAEAAPETLNWAKEFTRVLRRSKFETIESLAAFQGFFSGLGVGKTDAAGLSEEMHRLAVDFASFNNVTDEEGMRRFISGLSGSGEVLDRFGINIKEAAVNQKLLAKGLPTISQGATELMKVMARKELLAEALGSQGAIGDAIRTAGNLAGQLKALRAEVMDMSVDIGTALLPPAKEVVSTLAAWAKAAAQISVANPGLVVGIAKVAIGMAAIGTASVIAGVSILAYGMSLRLVGSMAGRLSLSFKTGVAGLRQMASEIDKKTKKTIRWRQQVVRSIGIVAGKFLLLSSQLKTKLQDVGMSLFSSAIRQAKYYSRRITESVQFRALVIQSKRAFLRIQRQGHFVAIAIRAAWNTIGPSTRAVLVRSMKLAFSAIKLSAKATGIAIGQSLRMGMRSAMAVGRGGAATISSLAGGAASATGAMASLTANLGTRAASAVSVFLSQITSVVFAVLMLGPAFMSILSPVGLVLAAVLAGGYAWVKFSESGRIALNRVLSYLKPFADTIKMAFGGITNAFRAGDLELAAKIAMVGLKVIFLEAMTDIIAIMDSTWGGAIGELASAITDADMPRAMHVATLMMKATWTNFTAAILKGFIAVARKVLGAWKSTVDALSNYFLKKAANGGVFGKAFKAMTGVDVRAEVERNRKLEAERRKLGLGGSDGDDIFSMFDSQTGGGGRDFLDEAADKIRESFTAIGKLANMTPDEIEAQVNKAIDDLESGVLPQFEKAASDAMTALEEGTSSGASNAQIRLKLLKDELAELSELAKKKADEAVAASEEKDGSGVDLGGLGGSKLGKQTEVTFSSAAALALGGGQSEGPTVRELKAVRAEMKEAAKEARRTRIAAEEQIKKDAELIALVDSKFKVPVFGT